jgi:hypothetical protein
MALFDTPQGVQEHLAWCKARASAYLDAGDLVNAVNSLTSDMAKHPQTLLAHSMVAEGMRLVIRRDETGVRRWIAEHLSCPACGRA